VRRILFWMHLCTGVLIGILVVYFSITGTLIAYERPILNAIDKQNYKAVPASAGAVRLPLATLISETESAAHARVEMITVHPDPVSPVELQTANREVFFGDAFSGAVQGPMSPRARAFFLKVTALHRWFGLSEAHHAAAAAVKGAVTLLFLFLLLSGATLWIPARWTSTTLRTGAVPRFDVRGRARNYNWHKVTGLWLGLPLAVIVVTGIIMAYPWANALLFRLAGSPVPVRNAVRENSRRHANGTSPISGNLDEAFTQATNNAAGWQSASLRLPANAGELNITVDRSEGGHPEKREQVFVEAATARVLRRLPFDGLSRGQRWRSWVRFIHTGEAGGWWGETSATATASGAILLSITGFLLAFHRLRRLT